MPVLQPPAAAKQAAPLLQVHWSTPAEARPLLMLDLDLAHQRSSLREQHCSAGLVAEVKMACHAMLLTAHKLGFAEPGRDKIPPQLLHIC